MITPNQRPQAAELVNFVRPVSPLAVFFVVVPFLAVCLIAVATATQKLPLPLIGLLLVVASSCVVWIKIALENVGAVVVSMTGTTLSIKRMLGSSSVEWSDIEAVKLVDPGPTLADNKGSHESRIGIGLYLRSKADTRDSDSPPDILVVTGMTDIAADIIRGCEKIAAFHRKVTSGGGAGGFGKQAKGFRRQTKAA